MLVIFACTLSALLVIALIVECGRVTANYAAQRGRAWRTWFVLGILFSPLFPLLSIVLALLPSYRRQDAVPSN